MPERTLALIKPEAVASNHIGNIIAHYEREGLQVAALKMVHPTKDEAKQFYAVHKERPFYNDLTDYLSSGPVVALVLQGKNAVQKHRDIIGATDPKKAASGTIRAKWGTSLDRNAVHGSDSVENAEKEIHFFFGDDEIYNRKSEPK